MTDQTMTERVGDAIAEALGRNGVEVDHERGLLNAVAMSAITAMREPTEAMLCDVPVRFDPPTGKQWTSKAVWNRMIDAALAEG